MTGIVVVALVAVLGLTGVAGAQTPASGLYGSMEYLMLTTNQFTIPVVSYPGGYFAQPTNMGSHTRTVVAVVPEASFNVGYRLTSWLSIVAGYTFLYASNVARPGEQIDRTVNPTQSLSFGGPAGKPLAGEARPRLPLEGSDFWAQGLSAGVALSF